MRGEALATAFNYETARVAEVVEAVRDPGGMVPALRRTDQASSGKSRDLFGLHLSSIRIERQYSEQEIWENYCWYLERILPVCEEVGLRLALHPDDPSVPSLGGIGRVFRNFENFRRALEIFDSPMHGLDFCHGC